MIKLRGRFPTVETAVMIDSKGKAALAKKFIFLANKLQAATSNGTLSFVHGH